MYGVVDSRKDEPGEIVIDGYKKGDVYKLKLREGDGFGVPPEEEIGFGWTMKKDGHPIGCGGFVHVDDGIGLVWMMMTDEVRGHGMKLCRFARRAVKIAFEEMGWHRIHAAVRVDRPEYMRWAQLMGFQCEGRLRKAAPDKTDLYVYARVL